MEEQNTELAKTITRVGSCIVVALPAELTDECISGLKQVVADGAYEFGVTGAILNFARVNVMDSSIYHEILILSKMIALMGKRVVWASISPGVVCALVDLGVPLDHKEITTVANLDAGLALLYC